MFDPGPGGSGGPREAPQSPPWTFYQVVGWLPEALLIGVAGLIRDLRSKARPEHKHMVWRCLGDQSEPARNRSEAGWSHFGAQNATSRLLSGSWPAPLDPAPSCLRDGDGTEFRDPRGTKCVHVPVPDQPKQPLQ